jgi:hypothetical protein
VPPGTNTDTDTDTDTDTGTDTGADQDKNDTAPPLLFVPLPPPTEQDIHELLARIARRIVSIAPRYRVPTHVIERLRMQLGMQDDPRLVDRDDLADLDANDASQDPRQALLEQTLHSALAAPSPERSTATAARCEAQAELASIESTAPLDAPASTLCARLAGFSLHAARTVDAEDRAGLERLCRYGLRPPFAADRLSIDPDGRVRYRLRKPWPTRNGGQRHELVLDPVDFLRRLAALVPPPYFNTVRYHGIFASRNRLHRRLPRPWPRSPETATPAEASATADAAPNPDPAPDPAPNPDPAAQGPPDNDSAAGNPAPTTPQRASKHSTARTGWAALLHRVFHIDALRCPNPQCTSRMVLLAFITDPSVITRILEHLGLHRQATPPPLAPAKGLFDDCDVEPELFGADSHRDGLVGSPPTPVHPRPPPWFH